MSGLGGTAEGQRELAARMDDLVVVHGGIWMEFRAFPEMLFMPTAYEVLPSLECLR